MFRWTMLNIILKRITISIFWWESSLKGEPLQNGGDKRKPRKPSTGHPGRSLVFNKVVKGKVWRIAFHCKDND